MAKIFAIYHVFFFHYSVWRVLKAVFSIFGEDMEQARLETASA